VRSELIRIEEGIPSTERIIPKRKPITSKEITVTFGLKKLFIPALVIIGLIIAVVIILQLLPQKETVPVPSYKHSIAVLPFDDLSPQKDQEYFCDGLAEELINRLNNIESLRVPARTSAFSFKGKELDLQEIGNKLNVEMLLEGSVQKAGNKLRITVRLVKVADGYPLWSEKYERDEKDIFALQDEISLAIVDNMRIKLLGKEKANLVKRYTEDIEAYNLYLQGLFFWNRRTEEDLKKAINYFEQAIEVDHNYALAYAGLADSYSILPEYSNIPPKEVYPKAKELALKALEIDNTLAEAHVSLGLIKRCYDYDWVAAEREYKRAIELNPGYAIAHYNYAYNLMCRALFDEAIKEMKQAHDLDPLSLIINRNLGQVYYRARQYDQAIKTLKRTLEMDPNFSMAHFYLGSVYLQKGMYEKALAEFQKEKELSRGWGSRIEARIGIIYMKMGRREKTLEMLDDFLEKSKQMHVPQTSMAILYFVLGENDQGFQWLDKGYEEYDNGLRLLKTEPIFDSVRSDPRFKTLLKKVGLE